MLESRQSKPLSKSPEAESYLPSRPHPTPSTRRTRKPAQFTAAALCFLYSLLLIANVHTANEGGWYWYGLLLNQGNRLYSQMQLPLQPLFVEETAAFLAIFGKSWLASKIAAVLHAALFCFGLHFILRRATNLGYFERSVLLTCGFFGSIGFVGYRFDDYHILTDCLQIYSILALLRLNEAEADREQLTFAAIAGALAGLAIATRINDGGALFITVVASVFFLSGRRRLLLSVVAFLAGTGSVVVAVLLTGDSLQAWAATSILGAASSKGGTASVFAHPMELPFSSFETLRNWQNLQFVLYLLISSALFGSFVAPLLQRRTKVRLWTGIAASAAIILSIPRYWHHGNFKDQHLIIDVTAVGIFVIFLLGALAVPLSVWKLWKKRSASGGRSLYILMLIPLGQLASGAMSSGGSHIGLYGPLATMIVLAPVVFPNAYSWIPLRGFTVAMAAVMTMHLAVFRWNVPYLWQTYRAERVFENRQWYRHPDYGPMIIDRDLLRMVDPICRRVTKDSGKELLSLPYPYPNYFCSIAPWHGYVQTFFDTSNSATIFHLIDELKTAPPKWIVYQWQPEVLSLHEVVYNHGQPLPHRYLDELIQRKLRTGEWKVVYTSNFGNEPGRTNEWMLILTRN